MSNSLSLLKYLRALSYEREKTISTLTELSFYKFFEDFPKNSPYVSIGGAASDFYFRIKRPFSSKNIEERRIQALYREFLNVYYIIENENEEVELLIGNAILKSSAKDDIDFPIFTKKVNISLNPQKEIIEITPSNYPPSLDVKLLSSIGNINPLELKRANEEMLANFYDPFISSDSHSFLKGLAKRLHIEGQVVENLDATKLSPLTLVEKNLFLLAPKVSKSVEAFDRAIAQYENGKTQMVIDAISGDRNAAKLTSSKKEGLDPLFTKEYNLEQEEVLQNSYTSPVTLVDGPPGSGKTHSVANMIGHFLAEGKRVLILSKKKKALKVIKNMIDPGFYGLIVSRIKDSNEDINETLYYINDFIMNHTTPEMKAKADRIEKEREDLILRMKETKKKVLDILESESRPIKLGEEEISPVEAANFVNAHKEILNLIPGEIKPLSTFPLNDDDLDFLYKSNRYISQSEEELLSQGLPDIKQILNPSEYEEAINRLDMIEFNELKYLPLSPSTTKLDDKGVLVDGIRLKNSSENKDLKERLLKLRSYINLPLWQENALKAGLNLIDNKAYKELSNRAIALDEMREKNIEIITGRSIEAPDLGSTDLEEALSELEQIYKKKDKPGTFDTLFKKNLKKTLSEFKINGEPIRSAQEASTALVLVSYKRALNELKEAYEELIHGKDAPPFEDYFRTKDATFKKLGELYDFKNLYEPLVHDLYEVIEPAIVNKIAPVLKNPTSDVLSYLSGEIYNLLELMSLRNGQYLPLKASVDKTRSVLNEYKDSGVTAIYSLLDDIDNKKLGEYKADYEEYKVLYEKKDIYKRRQQILSKLDSAPTWREFVLKRFGIHGEDKPHRDLKTAFKAKVLSREVERIVNSPYEKMRKMLSWYKKSIIESNREYAKTLAWYHFLKRMDENPEIRQGLKGLELTYKKLGKGTGFDAKELMKKADELILKCQEYVPCWVMTVEDAILNVSLIKEFDITVIDEASQADILSLPILFTSSKIIAIGDDKQTTPLYGGIPIEKVQSLRDTFLSDKFPNFHLMDMSTSFYDILKTSFPSYLLKEQFRSVPDIIEYSNILSYDGQILTLRDENDTKLKPALNLIHVDGVRDGDVNLVEQDYIIEKIKEIIADERYENKTIGVISLLGSQQAKDIGDRLLDSIDTIEYERRKMMSGTPTDFQGDERDIMFISMVDSPGEKPLRLMSEGAEDSNKKRFNVAFSRARDQEFLVTSLKEGDLKTGDLRLFTLEYFKEKRQLCEDEKPVKLTPFQQDIKAELEKVGFEVSSSHTAGKRKLPLVITNPKVAIYTTENTLGISRQELESNLEDTMLLERVGWKLAHIRQSKFIYEREAALTELIDSINNKR